MLFMSCVFMLLCLIIHAAALWSPAGKGLISWLLFVMFYCVFVTFPCDIHDQVWYLIVLILIFAVFLTLKICFSQFFQDTSYAFLCIEYPFG